MIMHSMEVIRTKICTRDTCDEVSQKVEVFKHRIQNTETSKEEIKIKIGFFIIM